MSKAGPKERFTKACRSVKDNEVLTKREQLRVFLSRQRSSTVPSQNFLLVQFLWCDISFRKMNYTFFTSIRHEANSSSRERIT